MFYAILFVQICKPTCFSALFDSLFEMEQRK